MTEHNPSSVKTLVVGLRNEEILTFSAEGDAHLVAGFEDGLFVVKECPSGRPYGFVPEEHVLYSFVEEWTEFHDPAAEPETAVSSSIDDFLSALMTPAASSDDEGDEDDDLLPPFTDTASFSAGDKVRVSLPAAVNPDNPNTAFIPEHDRGDTHVDAEIIERSGPTYFVMGPDRPQFVHPSFLSLREAGE